MRVLAASRRTIHLPPLVKAALFVPIMALAHPSSLAWAQEPVSDRDLLNRIDSLAAATLAAGRVAGLAVGVRLKGEVLLARGYGWADTERRVEATERTVFRVGSLTKQVTASAILGLVEDGRLDLDASLSALTWFSIP